MPPGTSRTSPQIVSSPDGAKSIIKVIYIDIDTLILDIKMPKFCLAVLKNVKVYNELNNQLPANISIVNNGVFSYSVTIDFLFPIVEHIINFVLEWDLSAYNGGYHVDLDSNSVIPYRKQLKKIIKKAANKIEKEPNGIDRIPNKITENESVIRQKLPKNSVPYFDLDIFTYKLRNRKRFKMWQLQNSFVSRKKIDFGILNINSFTILTEV